MLKSHAGSSKSGKSERSDTVLLVKNIPYQTTEAELRELFGRYGDLVRVVIPPTKTMALLEYSSPTEAKTGFTSLAYKNFHGRPLMLEKAPAGIFTEEVVQKKPVTDDKS